MKDEVKVEADPDEVAGNDDDNVYADEIFDVLDIVAGKANLP